MLSNAHLLTWSLGQPGAVDVGAWGPHPQHSEIWGAPRGSWLARWGSRLPQVPVRPQGQGLRLRVG